MDGPTRLLLVLNTGSSSLKFALFDVDGLDRREWIRGTIDLASRIPMADIEGGRGCVACLPAMTVGRGPVRVVVDAVFSWAAVAFPQARVIAAAHRVVHGGERKEAALVTPRLLEELAELEELAPLHQHPCLAVIRSIEEHHPDMVQTVSFDTALHMARARGRRLYALPRRYADEGFLQVGFHGLSCAHVLDTIERHHGRDERRRVVVAHLGSGSSVNAFVGGTTCHASMGTTPLDGVPMATRCGHIDPGAVLAMQRRHGLSAAELERILYQESGLLGLSGTSGDLRALLASRDARAAEAVDHLVRAVAREIAAAATAAGGVDVLVFTGGIGAGSAVVRARVASMLEWVGLALDATQNAAPMVGGHRVISSSASRIGCWAVRANEERVIAAQACDLLHALCMEGI